MENSTTIKPFKQVVLLFLIAGMSHSPQPMKPQDSESLVKFSIKNFGLTVNGTFKGLDGSVLFNPDDLPGSSIEASIDAGTINTGISSRDNHLKKKDYFDVVNYPRISFKSGNITAGTITGTYLVKGMLVMKATRKDIIIPFTADKLSGGFRFTGTFPLNRRDFGIGGSSISLSDNLTVSLTIVTK